MPKSYTYKGYEFSGEELVSILGETAVDASTESFDDLVNTRDKGTAEILAAYRAERGLRK